MAETDELDDARVLECLPSALRYVERAHPRDISAAQAIRQAIERFGVCECPTWHSSNAIFCRYCGRRVPHAD